MRGAEVVKEQQLRLRPSSDLVLSVIIFLLGIPRAAFRVLGRTFAMHYAFAGLFFDGVWNWGATV